MINIDQDESFDYEKNESILFNNDDLLQMIITECKMFETQKMKYKTGKAWLFII